MDASGAGQSLSPRHSCRTPPAPLPGERVVIRSEESILAVLPVTPSIDPTMTVRDVIRLIEDDGWRQVCSEG